MPNETPPANAPKVSVLIPVYNGERYLTDCLDSVLAQRFSDMEILIADDGSNDGSLTIIKKYAAQDARIRFWQNPTNLGLTGNSNACLHEARGEYIKFVHQDDKLLSVHAIEKLAAALDAHPAVTLAASASEVTDLNFNLKERRNFFTAGIHDGRKVICSSFEVAGNNLGEPSVVMFRKAQAARGFDPRYRQLWDLEMWCHLLEQGNFFYAAESLCVFRQHAGQQTQVNHRHGIGPNEMLSLLETYHAKPWFRALVSQRLLINQNRFLKKNQTTLGQRAERLRAELKAQIRLTSYPFFWFERKILRKFNKIKKL